jgi:hypothetical protein
VGGQAQEPFTVPATCDATPMKLVILLKKPVTDPMRAAMVLISLVNPRSLFSAAVISSEFIASLAKAVLIQLIQTKPTQVTDALNFPASAQSGIYSWRYRHEIGQVWHVLPSLSIGSDQQPKGTPFRLRRNVRCFTQSETFRSCAARLFSLSFRNVTEKGGTIASKNRQKNHGSREPGISYLAGGRGQGTRRAAKGALRLDAVERERGISALLDR